MSMTTRAYPGRTGRVGPGGPGGARVDAARAESDREIEKMVREARPYCVRGPFCRS